MYSDFYVYNQHGTDYKKIVALNDRLTVIHSQIQKINNNTKTNKIVSVITLTIPHYAI